MYHICYQALYKTPKNMRSKADALHIMHAYMHMENAVFQITHYPSYILTKVFAPFAMHFSKIQCCGFMITMSCSATCKPGHPRAVMR